MSSRGLARHASADGRRGVGGEITENRGNVGEKKELETTVRGRPPRAAARTHTHAHAPHGLNARDACTWDFYESLLLFTYRMCVCVCIPNDMCVPHGAGYRVRNAARILRSRGVHHTALCTVYKRMCSRFFRKIVFTIETIADYEERGAVFIYVFSRSHKTPILIFIFFHRDYAFVRRKRRRH